MQHESNNELISSVFPQVKTFPLSPVLSTCLFLSSTLRDECMQSGRTGSMQSIWLAGSGCHYSPVCIDTELERIKVFKHAYLALSLTAMFLLFFSLPLLPLPPSPPCFWFQMQQVNLMGITIKSLAEIEEEVSRGCNARLPPTPLA